MIWPQRQQRFRWSTRSSASPPAAAGSTKQVLSRVSLRRPQPLLIGGGMQTMLLRAAASLLPLSALAAAPPPVTPMTPDVVASYNPVLPQADFIKREAMVPMRDGVKLYTVIVMKKGTANGPILLPRPPYDARGSADPTPSQSIVDILPIMDKEFVTDG